MKRLNKTIAVILSAIFIVSSLASCKQQSNVGDSIPDNTKKNTVIQTNEIMVENEKTDYKIVIPADADITSYVSEAANELVLFLNAATGVNFPIVTDEGLTFKESDKYISLGRTEIFDQTSLEVDKEELGVSGYIIKSVGTSVFICGGDTVGTLYGAYEFLQHTIGWEYYSGTEIVYNELTKLYNFHFDVTTKPDFEYPYLSTIGYLNETMGSKRRRCAISPFIPNGMHNSFILVDPDVHKETHPEWFAVDENGNDVNQLNYTAGEGLVNEVVNQLIQKLETTYLPENYKSEQVLLFFGQEDYWGWDRRPASVALYEKYGTDAASLIIFLNEVATKLDVWVNENQPGREVYICTFAYQDTERPPVKYDSDGNLVLDKEGKAIPIDDAVRLRDNVVVRLAPIDANWYEPFDSESNRQTKNNLDGWNALGEIIFYLYSIAFKSHYAQFNNFNSLQENYQFIYESYKPMNLQDQYLSSGTNNPCFRDYRMYMQGKLMWDVYLDWQATTEDFFNNFYRDASDIMLTYLEEIRLLYMDNWKEVGLAGDCNTVNLYLPELWPRGTLLGWLKDFDEAFAAIEHYKTTDLALYKKLYERIEMETLSVRYLLIRLYGNTVYTEPELYKEKVDFFNLVVAYDMLPVNAVYTYEYLKAELGI